MLAQTSLGAAAQAAAGIGAEAVGVAGALLALGEGGAHVRLEVGLLEAFAGAAGEHARAVRVEAEEGGDLARGLLLDLGVPQHGLPALRQAPERLHGHRLLGLVHRADVRAEFQGVVVAHLGAAARGLRGEHREVVDQLLPLRRLRPPGGDAPDRGQQIGAHRVLGPAAATDGLEHAGEDLGGEVVGGVCVAAAGEGVPADGFGVPAVQLLVRGVVARPHPRDQVGVGRRRVLPGGERGGRTASALRGHTGAGRRGGYVGGVGAAGIALERHLPGGRLVPIVNTHPSTLIAERPRLHPRTRTPGKSATGPCSRRGRSRATTRPR